jgi:hypothetical protein
MYTKFIQIYTKFIQIYTKFIPKIYYTKDSAHLYQICKGRIQIPTKADLIWSKKIKDVEKKMLFTKKLVGKWGDIKIIQYFSQSLFISLPGSSS